MFWALNIELLYIQCNQAREQNFFISEFELTLAYKVKTIIDQELKFGTNLLQHKLYVEFKLWDVIVITSIFMASQDNMALQNMLGTLNEYYFLLRVCALPSDAHPYEVYLT